MITYAMDASFTLSSVAGLSHAVSIFVEVALTYGLVKARPCLGMSSWGWVSFVLSSCCAYAAAGSWYALPSRTIA